jgi:PAS domain-containing protein
VDVRYLIFQARKQAEDGTGTKGQMSALNRVAFEKHLADAKKQVYNALLSQVAFWAELAETKPDVTRCHRLSSEMNASITTAESAFFHLLALNSQSLLVLRLYADFTLYVVNNQEKAAILIADAERIEDQQTKEHHRESGAVVRVMQHSNLDILADNTAVVTIGASFNNLGIIISASPYTAKLFGYSRWQLERRNINMLIPSPIAEAHDGFLRNYLETGEGRIVDYTSVVFGLHRYVCCALAACHANSDLPTNCLQIWVHLPHAPMRT